MQFESCGFKLQGRSAEHWGFFCQGNKAEAKRRFQECVKTGVYFDEDSFEFGIRPRAEARSAGQLTES